MKQREKKDKLSTILLYFTFSCKFRSHTSHVKSLRTISAVIT